MTSISNWFYAYAKYKIQNHIQHMHQNENENSNDLLYDFRDSVLCFLPLSSCPFSVYLLFRLFYSSNWIFYNIVNIRRIKKQNVQKKYWKVPFRDILLYVCYEPQVDFLSCLMLSLLLLSFLSPASDDLIYRIVRNYEVVTVINFQQIVNFFLVHYETCLSSLFWIYIK